MGGQPARRSARRPRSVTGSAATALILVAMLVGALAAPTLAPASHVAWADEAADFVPSAASLPGFREEFTDLEGGLNDPSTALRRSFVAVDDSKRVIVSVAVGSSIANAHAILGARVNQLVRYQGWQIGPSDAIGDTGYAGSGPGPDGNAGAMLAFRIFAVAAEVTVTSPSGEPDIPLLDNVARLVARRIRNEPDAVAIQPGFPVVPERIPGIEPAAFDAPSGGVTVAVAPGAEVNGTSSGSPILVDTIVRTRITAVDRPWAYTGNASRPPEGMEYLTVDVQIDVHGQTQVIVALPDFWLTTFDGRSWSPVPGRGAELQPGAVPNDVSVHGWLTFMIPRNQPAVQLSWRLRTSQTLASQGDVDQTLAMPLTVGATATAGIGKQAPPAAAPVVGPSTAAPTRSESSSSSGSGGSSTVSGTRLQ